MTPERRAAAESLLARCPMPDFSDDQLRIVARIFAKQHAAPTVDSRGDGSTLDSRTTEDGGHHGR